MLEYHLAFEKRTLPEMRNTQENRTQWRVESTSKTLADGCPWSIFCDSEHLSAKHPSVAPSIPTWSKLWWSNDVKWCYVPTFGQKKSGTPNISIFDGGWWGLGDLLGSPLGHLAPPGWCYPRPGPPCSLLLTKATSTVRASHPILDPARRTVASDRSWLK